MRRDEAITCLKEIKDTCRDLLADAVALVGSKPDDLSKGYQVHIKTILDSETKRQVEKIASKHSLALKEEQGKIVIYQPKNASYQ
ncbi:MAG: hypothetical protein NWE98_05225 [Candidatus Bathyarchaeota archaeon]|nr:hypothetical protein [Candidatus Bathyarchaeota archaeon]